ncbi:MAG TPA: hypothetical protein VMJ32_15520 [Pirellulales bacterium]|nr:hypothetical protein [Pirellulales bacterium]
MRIIASQIGLKLHRILLHGFSLCSLVLQQLPSSNPVASGCCRGIESLARQVLEGNSRYAAWQGGGIQPLHFAPLVSSFSYSTTTISPYLPRDGLQAREPTERKKKPAWQRCVAAPSG